MKTHKAKKKNKNQKKNTLFYILTLRLKQLKTKLKIWNLGLLSYSIR